MLRIYIIFQPPAPSRGKDPMNHERKKKKAKPVTFQRAKEDDSFWYVTIHDSKQEIQKQNKNKTNNAFIDSN